ncbi:peroxidase 57-like [Lolium perenne]|uniref:peroxidase 57-like n=1 Tax=Lolium perenne TaxID=4522 RepID=UPI0021EB42F3|nr:peroxidase 57-like [Lolium perenne]
MALAAQTRAVLLVVAISVLGLATGGLAQLKNGFYTGKCGANDVETIVQGLVKTRVGRDAAIVAQLLRLQFHECAINGCDGGLLIDGPGSEKTATPNLSVKGYDLIATIKMELEKRCPGVVSCSDIEILATRDAAALAGVQKYSVRTGRRDRRRSSAADVKLPSEEDTAAQATSYFAGLGLTQLDMVVLLGAHTVGVTHCSKIKKTRLYSYGGKTGATDPSLHSDDVAVYKKYVCPNTASSDNNILYLDTQSSVSRIDNSYYKRLQGRHGVLSVDQNLYANGSSTKWHVDRLANTDHFSWLFPQALIKLSEINVLTGTQGEVRKVCSRFN